MGWGKFFFKDITTVHSLRIGMKVVIMKDDFSSGYDYDWFDI